MPFHTQLASSTTSGFSIRTQPFEAFEPMVWGSFVPWIPKPWKPGESRASQYSPSGFFGWPYSIGLRIPFSFSSHSGGAVQEGFGFLSETVQDVAGVLSSAPTQTEYSLNGAPS